MARHSKDEKPGISLLTFFRHHTGRHADEPVLEPDYGTKPETAFSNLRPDMFTGPTRPINWDKLAAPKRRHRWTWYLGSGALAAAVGLVLFAACSALSTDPGTYSGGDQAPAAISPSPCYRCSVTPDPTDGRQVPPPAGPVVLMTTTPPTSPPSPQRAMPRGTVTVTVPAAGQPSGESPSPYTGQPSGPTPTVTTTQTVTDHGRPEPVPTETVTQTVRATQTVYLPRPRVTVRVTVTVPSIDP